MITLKIDVKKIDKALLFVGNKGTYLDLVLHENKHGTDEFGNDGFIAQSVSKEKREAGERGPIIGNWKTVGAKKQQPKANTPAERPATAEDEDCPF